LLAAILPILAQPIGREVLNSGSNGSLIFGFFTVSLATFGFAG